LIIHIIEEARNAFAEISVMIDLLLKYISISTILTDPLTPSSVNANVGIAVVTKKIKETTINAWRKGISILQSFISRQYCIVNTKYRIELKTNALNNSLNEYLL